MSSIKTIAEKYRQFAAKPILFAPDIPTKVLDLAVKTHDGKFRAEDVVCVIDDSLLGKWNNGLVLAEAGIFSKAHDVHLTFDQVESAESKVGFNNTLTVNGTQLVKLTLPGQALKDKFSQLAPMILEMAGIQPQAPAAPAVQAKDDRSSAPVKDAKKQADPSAALTVDPKPGALPVDVKSSYAHLASLGDLERLEKRDLTQEELRQVKPLFDHWAASFNLPEFSGFASKVTLVKGVLYPSCRVALDTRHEDRTVEERVMPFDRRTARASPRAVDLGAFPLWSYRLSRAIDRNNGTDPVEVKVPDSDIIENCGDCEGAGKVECQTCRGDKKVVCPDCQGNGKVTCGGGVGGVLSRGLLGVGGCGGSGRIKCGNCRGSGKSDAKGTRCSKCAGHGDSQCTKCKGRGEVPCSTCGTRGEVPCEPCGATGKIQCAPCGGMGQMIASYFLKSEIKPMASSAAVPCAGRAEIPADVKAWDELGTTRNVVATAEFERLGDGDLAKYGSGEIAQALSGLLDEHRGASPGVSWTSDGEAVALHLGETRRKIVRQWVDELYSPLARVEYEYEGKPYAAWCSLPRRTMGLNPKAAKDGKGLPDGHHNWREGTCLYASVSPIHAHFSGQQDQAKELLAKKQFRPAWDKNEAVLKSNARDPASLALRKRIKGSHAKNVMLGALVGLAPAGLIGLGSGKGGILAAAVLAFVVASVLAWCVRPRWNRRGCLVAGIVVDLALFAVAAALMGGK